MIKDRKKWIEDNSEIISETGCWVWMKSLTRGGYGNVRYEGDFWKIHRLSHHLFNGPIPDGFVIMHRCDVPCCVNPEHLKAGTQAENMADREQKGRGPWKARLAPDQVEKIKKSAETPTALSKRYRISTGLVWKIKRNKVKQYQEIYG